MAAINLNNVIVDIPVYNTGNRSLKNTMIASMTGGQIRSRDGQSIVIRALDGITLDLHHGQRVGLIGHNGAGKSTILRVVAGIYEPTSGTVSVNGEVASMFDIGFGMDPDASGWQNIVLRGMLLGLSKKEIQEQSKDIGEVSGLGEFLDMPLRTYSSGMATRLAFAISTAITPDILLVDEGIGAGDAAFMADARERLTRFIGGAGMMLMASHSDTLLQEWCNTGLWIEHGRIRMLGDISDVIAAYHESVAALGGGAH